MMKRTIFNIITVIIILAAPKLQADTFTNKQSGEKLTGYTLHKIEGSQTYLQTKEKGKIKVNLANWKVEKNFEGRNNKIITLRVEDAIMYKFETEALVEEIKKSSDKGPLFILLEIDTPGGRTDLARQIGSAIRDPLNCPIYAYISGKEHGGAISAGAYVALSCDKIFMQKNSVIGAATPWMDSKDGPQSLRDKFGDDVGEKFLSAWKGVFASAAEAHGKSGLLAKAMIDKDIEVLEVKEGSKTDFIEPQNRLSSQQIVKTWTKKDDLLTLTGQQAIGCKMADGLVTSRQEILKKINASDARIEENNEPQDAREEVERAQKRLQRLMERIDYYYEKLKQSRHRAKSLRLLRKLRSGLKRVMITAKKYPDLQMDEQQIQARINEVEAIYKEHTRR